MRVGILADTHLSQLDCRPLLLSLAKGPFARVDAVLHAGDIGDLDWLQDVAFAGIPLWAVVGNCDPPSLSARLPQQRVVEFGAWRIGLVHGWGSPHRLVERVAPLFADVHAVVFGHSHRPQMERRKGVLFFNPGSLGDPRGGPPTAGLMSEERGRLVFQHLTL